MAETEHTQENIAYIRTHVDKLEQMVRFEISSNPNSRHRVQGVLEARAGAPEFYLALADGPKTQEQLARHLGKDKSNVSRIGSYLLDSGLIASVPAPEKGGRFAFAWTDFEKLLGVSKIARQLVGNSTSTSARDPGEDAP